MQSNYRPIRKLRRLAHIPLPAADNSQCANIEAYRRLLTRANRVAHSLASETVEEVAQMLEKELDVSHPFKTDGKKSFPRKDYTPHATYVDCRERRGPSSPLGSSSFSDDGDDE